jgi:ectoine hydroxylase-related dioxygenase (phytanoyl-CoA dioxygenase family)
MQFLPGSHRSEIIEHRNVGLGAPLVLEDAPDLSGAVACPIPAGAATVHHCRTIHYSGPNTSERPRRAISALFHGPVQRRDEPLERTWLPLAPKFAKS